MKNTKNDVLVVIPTLGKRERYLHETMTSLEDQVYRNFDIVFVCPKDSTAVRSLADSLGAGFVDDPKTGLSGAVNAGVSYAKPHHKYISWINDDDLLTPESIKTTVAALESDPDAPAAFGNIDYIDDSGKLLFTNRTGSIAQWIMTWGPNLVPCPGSLFRISDLIEVGCFDENNRYSMDLDVFLALRKKHRLAYCNTTLARFRWHSDSISVAGRDQAIKEAEAVKLRHMSPSLRPFARMIFPLVRISSMLAAKRIGRLSS